MDINYLFVVVLNNLGFVMPATNEGNCSLTCTLFGLKASLSSYALRLSLIVGHVHSCNYVISIHADPNKNERKLVDSMSFVLFSNHAKTSLPELINSVKQLYVF